MKLDIPTSLLICYLTRLLIFGASVGDALVMLSLAGLFGFIQHLNTKKIPEVNQEIKSDLELIKKEFTDVKSKVNALTIGNQFRR